MKPTTAVGLGLIGLAVALVGVNFLVPNWPVSDTPAVVMTPLPTLGTSHFADSDQDAIDNGEHPGNAQPPVLSDAPEATATPEHLIPKPRKHVVHIKTHPHAEPTPGFATPLPAPSLIPDTSGVDVINGDQKAETSQKASVEGPTVIDLASPAPHEHHQATQATVVHPQKIVTRRLNGDDLARITEQHHQAEIDAVRRTAIGAASTSGTTVKSADVEDLKGGNYRVVLVENNPHGTAVESITYRAEKSGFTQLDRHTMSDTSSDPEVGEPPQQ